ncbi:hypothetical protein SAMN04487890_1143 [Mucilaginibacter polytrichastri]|nr:hypothetical protein SAMN04487890_1143 [Mucilaginibacter polytrichastri]
MMKNIFNLQFVQSIIWINNFDLHKNLCSVDVVCIENNSEVAYKLELSHIVYHSFRQESNIEEFEVIETVIEDFNNCEYVKFMWSSKWSDFKIIRFHSGIHHLIIGFGSYRIFRT